MKNPPPTESLTPLPPIVEEGTDPGSLTHIEILQGVHANLLATLNNVRVLRNGECELKKGKT